MATKPQVACGWMHTTHKSTGAQRPHESKQPSRLANHVSRAVAYLGQQQYVYANIATIKMQRAAICSGALVDCQSTGALMKRCISLAANASARSHVYVHARCFATTMDSASVGILYHNPSKHTLRPRMRPWNRRLTNTWLCRLCAFRVLKVAYDEGIVGWDGSGVHYRGVPQDPTHHGRSANSAHRIG